MQKAIFYILIGFVLGSGVSTAYAKYEASALDATPTVLYGKNGSTLVPILVDSNGVVQLQ